MLQPKPHLVGPCHHNPVTLAVSPVFVRLSVNEGGRVVVAVVVDVVVVVVGVGTLTVTERSRVWLAPEVSRTTLPL